MLLHKLLRLRYKLGRLNHVHPAAFELIDELMELLLEVDHQFGKIPEDDPKQLYRFMQRCMAEIIFSLQVLLQRQDVLKHDFR